MATDPDKSLTTSELAGRRSERSPQSSQSVYGADRAQRDDVGGDEANRQPLLSATHLDGLRLRWDDVEAAFVDEPRRAVAEADGLVADAMQQLADTFAQEREHLEAQWDRGEGVSTEELRVALQRYRSFFNRLLQT